MRKITVGYSWIVTRLNQQFNCKIVARGTKAVRLVAFRFAIVEEIVKRPNICVYNVFHQN